MSVQNLAYVAQGFDCMYKHKLLIYLNMHIFGMNFFCLFMNTLDHFFSFFVKMFISDVLSCRKTQSLNVCYLIFLLII